MPLKDELPRLVGVQYATAEEGKSGEIALERMKKLSQSGNLFSPGESHRWR